MIVLRQKDFSWNSAKKAISETFGEGTKRANTELFWGNKSRDSIARKIKAMRKAGIKDSEVRDALEKEKNILYEDWKLLNGMPKETAAKIANLKAPK